MINNNEKRQEKNLCCRRRRRRPRQICVHDFINLMRNELNPCIACTRRTTPKSSVSNKLLCSQSVAPFVLYLISYCVNARHHSPFIAAIHTIQFPDHYFIPCSVSTHSSSSSSWLVSQHIRQKHHFLSMHVSRVLFNSPQCLNYIYRPSVCCVLCAVLSSHNA